MVPVEVIKECKAFKMFPDHLIEEIAFMGEEKAYKANEMIFNIDEPADFFAILMKGKVAILTSKRTQLIPVLTIYPGGAFALSSMIRGLFVGAARAMEDCSVCRLPVDKMNQILEKDYKAGFLFMKQTTLYLTNWLVRMLAQLDIAGPGYG